MITVRARAEGRTLLVIDYDLCGDVRPPQSLEVGRESLLVRVGETSAPPTLDSRPGSLSAELVMDHGRH